MTELKGTNSKPARRVLNIIRALKGFSLTGLSNSQLAERLNESQVNISRALAVLLDEGFVIRLAEDRFALSIQVLQIATAHANECNLAIEKVEQLNQRIAAGALS
ncbi:IclR family transcriptional regulator [Pasteurella canis]|uniref:IclR family transcriptional regulator n=1 Tax=Pasteurella canis TaxID=753 RepID=UPI001E5D7D60|nr:IclR family transcriptional regulator [Pasteurella canis]UEA17778.1 IclR family transcriptional regulator [Pasteurella canis]